MRISSLNNTFQHSSPPPLLTVQEKHSSESLNSRAAAELPSSRTLRNTLKAMASLAVVLAPQANAAAAEMVQVESVGSTVEDLKEKGRDLKRKIDPQGLLRTFQNQSR